MADRKQVVLQKSHNLASSGMSSNATRSQFVTPQLRTTRRYSGICQINPYEMLMLILIPLECLPIPDCSPVLPFSASYILSKSL